MITARTDSGEESVISLEERWREIDSVFRQRPSSREIQNREKHAQLVGTGASPTAVNDQTSEFVLIFSEAHFNKSGVLPRGDYMWL